MSLQELRDQIDAIDREWISLLKQRLEVAKQIALVKKCSGLPIFDAQRERMMKEEIRRLAREKEISVLMAEEIFHQILIYSKHEMQRSAELSE